MITLLFGENSFEIENALNDIIAGFDGTPEKVKTEDLQTNQLPDLLMGVSLFSDKRLVILRNLSENKSIWSIIPNWIEKISDDIKVVFVESKIDKRSITYKALKDKADVHEFLLWSERDTNQAEKWVINQAKKIGLSLDARLASLIVRRVGVNQWALDSALEKLSFIDGVTQKTIEDLIEPNLSESVFDLFETAVSGDVIKINNKLDILEQTEDIYKLSGLLFTQAFQLAVIASASSANSPSKDFAIHPFVASKLSSVSKKIGKNGIAKIIKLFAKADLDMKTSKSDPWLILRNSLNKIASL